MNRPQKLVALNEGSVELEKIARTGVDQKLSLYGVARSQCYFGANIREVPFNCDWDAFAISAILIALGVIQVHPLRRVINFDNEAAKEIVTEQITNSPTEK